MTCQYTIHYPYLQYRHLLLVYATSLLRALKGKDTTTTTTTTHGGNNNNNTLNNRIAISSCESSNGSNNNSDNNNNCTRSSSTNTITFTHTISNSTSLEEKGVDTIIVLTKILLIYYRQQGENQRRLANTHVWIIISKSRNNNHAIAWQQFRHRF